MELIYVKDVYNPKQLFSTVVYADEPLEQLLHRFAGDDRLRGIFVTNKEKQLVGIITRADLLEWTRLRMGTGLHSVSDRPERLLRLAHLVGSASAGEAMQPVGPQTAVRLDDTLDVVLERMVDVDVVAIPVVDRDGHILGDLTLSQVLRHALSLGVSDVW